MAERIFIRLGLSLAVLNTAGLLLHTLGLAVERWRSTSVPPGLTPFA
jgi:hypothetical protein